MADGLQGLEQVHALLVNLIEPARVEVALTEGLSLVREEASRFPPQPDRMRSGHLNTWVREVGRMPASMFVTRAGSLRKHPRRAVGMSPNPPSEKLLANWAAAQPKISHSGLDYTATLTNPVTYAPFVQGEQQANFHAATGWKKVGDILAADASRILQMVSESLLTRK